LLIKITMMVAVYVTQSWPQLIYGILNQQ